MKRHSRSSTNPERHLRATAICGFTAPVGIRESPLCCTNTSRGGAEKIQRNSWMLRKFSERTGLNFQPFLAAKSAVKTQNREESARQILLASPCKLSAAQGRNRRAFERMRYCFCSVDVQALQSHIGICTWISATVSVNSLLWSGWIAANTRNGRTEGSLVGSAAGVYLNEYLGGKSSRPRH